MITSNLPSERRTLFYLLTSLVYVFFCFSLSPAHENKSLEALRFTNVTSEAGFASLGQSKSYSAAAADYNLDGFVDLLICQHNRLSLWTNTGKDTFRNTSDLLDFNKGDMHGVSFIDINNDGYPDICVSLGANRGRGSGGNLFFLNQTGEKFKHMSNPPEVLSDAKGRGRSITPTDFNNDGLIDLLIMNQYQEGRPNRIALADKKGGFVDMGPTSGISSIKAAGLKVVDLNNDGTNYYIATGHGKDSGKIFMEKGTVLIDVSKTLGISEESVISSLPFDYDNDNDFDLLFLHRTFSKPLGVSIVDGEIHFSYYGRNSRKNFKTLVSKGVIRADVRFEGRKRPELLYLGRGKVSATTLPWTGDVNSTLLKGKPEINQEEAGLYVWHDADNFLNFYFAGSDNLEAVFGSVSVDGTEFDGIHEYPPSERPELIANSFYRNDNGFFKKITEKTSIESNGLGRDAIAADFNNDGYLDVYQVNAGYSFIDSNPANQLFLNRGDGTFEEVAESSFATGAKKGAGNGSIAFDYDNDGDLDLFLYNGFVTRPMSPGPIILLRNDTPNIGKSIQIDPRGVSSNRRGWGVKVVAKIDGEIRFRQKNGLNGFLATSDLPIHIGIGSAENVTDVLVLWPSGKAQRVTIPNYFLAKAKVVEAK